MDLSERIGRYCERLGPEFWAEPFNAISNAAFLLAAIAGYFIWLSHGSRDRAALILIAVAFSVGIGSFLFHTFMTPWSYLADVIPIAVFIASYLLLALHRFLRFGLVMSVVLLAVFEAITVLTLRSFPPAFLNRAVGYVPALVALILIGGTLLSRNAGDKSAAAGRALLLAAMLFAISLFFRTVDLALCNAFPAGTHFLWHIFNALVIFVLLHAAILHGPEKAGR